MYDVVACGRVRRRRRHYISIYVNCEFCRRPLDNWQEWLVEGDPVSVRERTVSRNN